MDLLESGIFRVHVPGWPGSARAASRWRCGGRGVESLVAKSADLAEGATKEVRQAIPRIPVSSHSKGPLIQLDLERRSPKASHAHLQTVLIEYY